jgi:purine-binding chemotaxis protein CheW
MSENHIHAGKYLTFRLKDEDYGIAILKVREIIGMMPVTTVPKMPEYVQGVINLRGKVIPVIDLRQRFGMEKGEYSDRTCIVVAEIEKGDGKVQIGIIVDAVSEVLNIQPENIEQAPSFGASVDTRYIRGMAKLDGGVKILLDIDLVLTGEELTRLEQAA